MLNELAQHIHEANKEKGFWDKERNVGEMLMLIVSEAGEAMEAHRKGLRAQADVFKSVAKSGEADHKMRKHAFETLMKDTFEDEIADTIIRILDLCSGLGIDIATHVSYKLEYNKTRERLHGKNY